MAVSSYLRLPLRDEPWSAGSNGWHICPVCGENWRPWSFSLLPCHAKCLLNEEGVAECLRWHREETRPLWMLSQKLGLSEKHTESVVRSTLHHNGVPKR